MTTWTQLFGDQLATTSGGQQGLFPTDEHLGGEQYCMVVVSHELCPRCPAFFSGLQTMKSDMEAKGVGLVCAYQADTPQEHLRVAEKYGEVHMPTGFPTPPELLAKKRYLSEMIGKSVPSYAVFDASLQVVVDVATATLRPLASWLETLKAARPGPAADVGAGHAEDDGAGPVAGPENAEADVASADEADSLEA